MANLGRERDEALALNHEHVGVQLRLAGVEERCRQLEDTQRERLVLVSQGFLRPFAVGMWCLIKPGKSYTSSLAVFD